MDFIDGLFERIDQGELKATDIPLITALIFCALIVVLALIGSAIYGICVFFIALLTGSIVKLALSVLCAIIFSLCLAIAAAAFLYLANKL